MIENDKIKKLASMPDSVLKEKISIAVNAAGGGDISLTDENIQKIKQAVMGMTEKDIAKLMSSFDQSKIDIIKNSLNNG